MMQPSFTIRPATPDDVPAIVGFVRELAAYENLSHEVTATVEQMRDQLFGPTPRAEVLIACENGIPVGLALFFHNFSTFLAKPGLYIEDIYIQPAHRGKGYGKALMISLARLAVERGCGRFEWTVLDWNQPSIDFYKSLGAELKPEWVITRVAGAALEALAQRALLSP
jgi:GNAT superfamily N-acetyltransferase